MGKGGWCLEACEEETTPADLCSAGGGVRRTVPTQAKIRLLSLFGKLATAVEPPRGYFPRQTTAGWPAQPREPPQGLSWVASFLLTTKPPDRRFSRKEEHLGFSTGTQRREERVISTLAAKRTRLENRSLRPPLILFR